MFSDNEYLCTRYEYSSVGGSGVTKKTKLIIKCCTKLLFNKRYNLFYGVLTAREEGLFYEFL